MLAASFQRGRHVMPSIDSTIYSGTVTSIAGAPRCTTRQPFRIAFFQSGEHRDNRLNLVGCRGYQAIVACHAVCGSLQNDFSQVRL